MQLLFLVFGDIIYMYDGGKSVFIPSSNKKHIMRGLFMKKKLAILLVILIMATLTLTACDSLDSIIGSIIGSDDRPMYNVEFFFYEGYEGGARASAKEGELIHEPTSNPSREGFTFGGWYRDEECTEK